MGPLRALLLFPIRPSAASAALAESRLALAAPFLPSAAAFAYLLARGCRLPDAAAGGAALLLLLAAAGAGGALLLGAARRFLGAASAAGGLLGACLACSAWTPLLFLAALAAARGLGAGSASALAAGLALLVWGVAMGLGMLADGIEDGGRALVASCLGMTGALTGLWLGLALAPRLLLTAVPCPADVEGLRAGGLLLVRVEARPPPGSLVLLTGAGREGVLARSTPDGFAPLGADAARVAALGRLEPLGRVFFRFGGPWGGGVVPIGHPGKARYE